MSVTQNSRGVLSLRAANIFSTRFQQIFIPFCVFIADSYIFLFLRRAVPSRRRLSASKSQQLLITIACLAPLSNCRGEACCHFAPPIGVRSTNRIQREFLFNNCIQSQNIMSASSHPRQKTNFLKQFASLCVLCVSVVKGLLLRRYLQTFSNELRFKCPYSDICPNATLRIKKAQSKPFQTIYPAPLTILFLVLPPCLACGERG
jgi:hypothetical protein